MKLPRAIAVDSSSTRYVPGTRSRMAARAKAPGSMRGFSLIEMMIAIVILGFGLIMVATMFPIAWSRARNLTEFTTQVSATEAAEAAAKLLLRVDGLNDASGNPINRGSFAGDLLVDLALPPPSIVCYGDYPAVDFGLAVPVNERQKPRVHALHMENILVSPRAFLPDREDPEKSLVPHGAPWMLEHMGDPKVGLAIAPFDLKGNAPWFFTRAFGGAQIRFEERVYPPMRPRLRFDAGGTEVTTIEGEFKGDDPQWDDMLDTRRYAFAIFHRLRTQNGPAIPLPTDLAEQSEMAVDAVKSVRVFDMYYVTLRRAQSTYRFAQQNPLSSLTPDPLDRENPVEPQALPPDSDVLFPAPWRVQVTFPWTGATPPLQEIETKATALGIPTEVAVNVTPNMTARFVIDMFPEGAFFIDEVNGQVYRVVSRRIVPDFADPNNDQAFLTLDREVVAEDLDDFIPDGLVEPAEALRAVWVFPPPVQAQRAGDDPIFVGSAPVMGIEVRSLSFSPL